MEVGIYTELWFGKYKGECVGDVIYEDADYIRWAFENIEGFCLNFEASCLLSEIEESFNTSWEENIW